MPLRREMRAIVAAATLDTHRMADLNERVRLGDLRLAEIRTEVERLEAERINKADVDDALGRFDALWNQLKPESSRAGQRWPGS